ncbi:hypothetical protein [Mesorhizobium sp. M0522]|uniref:hypothetical protein n=1 Tax=Mesorhizobium sp. M0522 TaxID=2956958 RepID=UPI00333AB6FB
MGGGDQTTTSTVDYEAMVRSAEKAGFNPLTAIRNGGAAGFTRTTTPGNPLAAGLSAAGSWLTNFDPYADAARDQASRLVEAQIGNLNAETGSYQRTAATPSGPVLRRPGTAGISGSPAALPAGKVSATNPLPGRAVIDPTFADADAWEARYSDPGGWVGALVNVGADMDANIRRYWPGADTVFADGRRYIRSHLPTGNPWMLPPASGNQPGGQAYVLPPLSSGVSGGW